MDEMKLRINSDFMRKMIGKIVSKIIFKKTGYHVIVQLNSLDVSMLDGDTRISLSADAHMNNTEFVKAIRMLEKEE